MKKGGKKNTKWDLYYFTWKGFFSFNLVFLILFSLLDLLLNLVVFGLVGINLFEAYINDLLLIVILSLFSVALINFMATEYTRRIFFGFQNTLTGVCRQILNNKTIVPSEKQACEKFLDLLSKEPFFADQHKNYKHAVNQFNRNIEKLKELVESRQIELEMKGEYIAIMSHRLRTPLSSIRWNAEMLGSGDLGKLNPQQFEAVNDLSTAINRSLNLVEELLKVSNIETNQVNLNFRDFSVQEMLDHVLDKLQFKIKARNVQVLKKYPANDLTITCDKEQLIDILINLVDNAVKYSSSSTKGLVEVGYKKQGTQVLLWVDDNGVGVPDSSKDKIFEKFYRAPNALDLDTEGTGLGLYIVNRLVVILDGKLKFNSKENEGTKVEILLPIKRKS